jgi:hypothetical protein
MVESRENGRTHSSRPSTATPRQRRLGFFLD